MTQVLHTNFLKKFIAVCASESMINKMRKYDPEQLRAIHVYETERPDWPWPDPEERAIYWRTYHRMVGTRNGYDR